MSLSIYIYGLTDPRTGDIRYVGKAKSMVKRWKQHCSASGKTGVSHRACWLRSLHKAGVKPGIIMLAWCDSESWQQCEIDTITHRLSLGDKLINGTAGGDMPPNGSIANKPGERNKWAMVKNKVGTYLRDAKKNGYSSVFTLTKAMDSLKQAEKRIRSKYGADWLVHACKLAEEIENG